MMGDEMGWNSSGEPDCISLVVEGKARDLGGFEVRRLLPSANRRMVGPIVFFDHMGPVRFAPGQGLDVRPHPHIGLATVTYLFEGEIIHRDSLGFVQAITPGAVNWMTAGRGIVHSERTAPAVRAAGGSLHGIQAWIALPVAREEIEPSFHHHAAQTLPVVEQDGASLRVIAGAAFGALSPVITFSPMFYADAAMQAGASVRMPEDYEERALYVAQGMVAVASKRFSAGTLIVFEPGMAAEITAPEHSRAMLLGGAPMPESRAIWWNFVSSSPERIERAKADWKGGRFGQVPGETESIALPAI
jgi:redox-sensitive bicupin YhaK (pirin superfamily)